VKISVPPEPGIDPLSSLSVIVPVYECAERLPRHLEALQTFAHRVQEIVWVITESPDGSAQVAREAAARLGGRILEVPRGLYAAWNAGIAAAAGEFLYISTVGDLISADGLTALLGLLRQTEADVAVSPPKIYPPSKANLKMSRHWPLFHFEKLLRTYVGKVIPRRQAILMQILSGASGLTGSCASCLFRASALKNRPFPLDHHHYGDTAWLYRYLPEITLAYWPDPLARFEIHDKEIKRIIEKSQIYGLINLLAKHLSREEEAWTESLTRSCLALDQIRDPHPRNGWWLLPKAWNQRFTREISRFRLKRRSITVQ
jgi:glycosyltransferase involved in cell wall biosynthesis